MAAACLVALAGAAWWLGYTAEGLRWALAHATKASGGRLVIEGARGALARQIEIDRLAWTGDGVGVVARELRGRLQLRSLLVATIRIDELRAAGVDIALSPAPAKAPPRTLGFAPTLQIPNAEVGQLVFDDYVVTRLRLSYRGGIGGHEVRELSALTPWGSVALEASMQAAPPFAISGTGTLERREGKLSVSARILPLAERKIESLKAHAEGIDLAAFDAALPHTALRLQLDGASSADSLLAGKISAANAQPGPLDQGRLPAASLAAGFTLKGQTVLLEDLQARAAGGTIRGRGVLERERAQLDLQLAQIDLRTLRATLRATHLAGNLHLDLARREQAVQGTLRQDGMRLSADALRKGDLVEVRSLRVEAGGGVATGSGRVRLAEPIGAEGKLQFSRFDPAQFGDYPAGSISGQAEVSGNMGAPRHIKEAPRRLAARWSIVDSILGGQPLASRGSAQLSGERLHEVDASVQLGAIRFSAAGAFGAPADSIAWSLHAPKSPFAGFTGAIDANGTAGGPWKEPRLAFTAKSAPAVIADRLKTAVAELSASGTLREHAITLSLKGDSFDTHAALRGGWSRDAWEGRLLELRNAGRFPLQLAEPVPLRVAKQALDAGTLRARLGDGHLLIRKIEWRPGRLATSGEFAGLPASWVLVPAGLGEKLRSSLLLDGRWALESTPLLNGDLSIRRAAGDLSLVQPALEMGLRDALLEARFEQGRVAAKLDANAALGAVHVEANAAGFARDSALRFSAKLDVADIRALAGPLPTQVRIAGRASAALEGRGTLGEPEIAGTASADGLSLHFPPYGVYLDDGKLRATLQGDAVRIDELTLRGGDGRLSASGILPLREQKGASATWTAQNLRLLGRPDMRLVVSGQGSAAIENKRLALQGKVHVDNGRLARGINRLPKLGEDIVIASDKPETQVARRAQLPLDVDLLIDLGDQFAVREAGFDGLLKGQVHVSSVAGGELRAFGRIQAVNATFRAYDRNLVVDPGEVIFNGPIDNPALQITAWRRNQAVEVAVRITGNLQQPQVELVSDSPLPEGAKLSWLVLGRAPSDAAGADLGVLQTAASALFGRGGSGSITTRIADAVGLDEISLRGSSASSSSSDVASRVVALGKRLSNRIYLTYEQGLGAAAQNLVKIDLSLTARIAVRAQTGTTSGLGVYYRYSWD